MDNFGFVDKMADNIRKFGMPNAISGWSIIDVSSEIIQRNIFENLKVNNLMIIVAEDFTKNANSKEHDTYNDWNLEDLFDKTIGKPLNFRSPEKNGVVESAEKIDQYHKDFKAFYHYQ